MDKGLKLGWNHYPSFDDIISDRNSTLFVTLNNDEESQQSIQDIYK